LLRPGILHSRWHVCEIMLVRNLRTLALWCFKRSEDATSKDTTTTVKLYTYIRPITAFTVPPSKSDH
jgi:hypothetical protein